MLKYDFLHEAVFYVHNIYVQDNLIACFIELHNNNEYKNIPSKSRSKMALNYFFTRHIRSLLYYDMTAQVHKDIVSYFLKILDEQGTR